MTEPIVLTRDKVRREWSDFEPKLVAAILSGGGSAIIIAVVTPMAKKAGIDLTPEIAAQIPLVIAGFIGWLTPSVGTTVTKKVEGNGRVSETHSGNPVTTVTAPTQIVRSDTAPSTPIQQTSPGVFTKIISEPTPDVQPTAILPSQDDRETEILPPPYARGASLLDAMKNQDRS